MTAASSAHRYAVIGNPIAHSRSPGIHALFAAQTGEPVVYDRILAPLDGFAATIQAFFAEGGRGLNVTVPFKLEAWDAARAHLSLRARQAGAANTLWMQDGALHGCNTDGVGLLRDLARLSAPLAGARVLLVGAGGAARGALGPLMEAGCAHIRVVNRTPARAHTLVAEVGSTVPGAPLPQAGGYDDARHPQGWQLVINATASGLSDEAPALPSDLYAPDALAYDMMYGATPPAFLRQAQADGAARTADGLGMLVEQAAESFRLWRGVTPATAPVLAALRARLDAEHASAGARR